MFQKYNLWFQLFSQLLTLCLQITATMATATRTFDNFSVCDQLTEEELIQIAIERSFDDRRPTNNFDHTPSRTPPSPAPPPLQRTPGQTSIPSRNNPTPTHTCTATTRTQPSVNPPRQVQNSANPPTSLSMQLLERCKR